jgi:hypothetical protein
MSARYSSTAGVELGLSTITFAWSKWAGGADGTGPYHVWVGLREGDYRAELLPFSQHAVVDDFGNLVRVPS